MNFFKKIQKICGKIWWIRKNVVPLPRCCLINGAEILTKTSIKAPFMPLLPFCRLELTPLYRLGGIAVLFVRHLPPLLNKTTASILFLFIAFVGCNSPQEKPTAQNIITITDEDLKYKYKASDVFEDLTFIPLETTDESLIGNIHKMIIKDSFIYVLDGKSIALLMFDIKGKFISKIGSRGSGPNEYYYLDDFTVLNNKDILILGGNKRIIHFKSDGTPYKTYYTSFFADSIESFNDSLLVLAGSGFDDRVIIWNIKTEKVINSFFKYDEKYSATHLKPLIKYAENIYSQQNFSSLIYKVTPEQLINYWFIDFGERTVTEDKIKEVTIKDGPFKGVRMHVLPSSVAYLTRFTETKDFVIFSFQIDDIREGMPHYVYHSKLSDKHKILVYGVFDDDMSFDTHPIDVLDAIDSGQVFGVLDPAYYIESFSKCDTTRMDAVKKQRWLDVKEQLKGIDEFDNPIVAIYSLKIF
jgi:hypothetical protein